MKTRNGFVSNSSSSSFCVIGWRTTLTTKQIEKLLTEVYRQVKPKDGWTYPGDILDNFDFSIQGEICGIRVRHWDDSDDAEEVGFDKFMSLQEGALRVAWCLNLPPPSLFLGTRYS